MQNTSIKDHEREVQSVRNDEEVGPRVDSRSNNRAEKNNLIRPT